MRRIQEVHGRDFRDVFAKGSKWADKVAAGFTNAASRSGDKLATNQQIAVFAAQHRMHWVNLGLPPGHNHSKSTEDTLNRHGVFPFLARDGVKA